MKNFFLKTAAILVLSSVYAFAYGQSCGVGTSAVTIFADNFGTLSGQYGYTNSPNATPANIYAGSSINGTCEYSVVADCSAVSMYVRSGFDHTDDAVGAFGGMMYLDSPLGAVPFYSKEVSCSSNTDINLSVWFASAHPTSTSYPNLTLHIWGKNLNATYTMLDNGLSTLNAPANTISGLEWHQLTCSVNSGAYTTLKIELSDNNYSSSGNDLVVDDIELVECQVNTATTLTTASNIVLTPNPVDASFQVLGLEGKASITLSDLNGRVVLSKEIYGNEDIPTYSLPQGVYVLKVSTASTCIEKKLIKK